MTVGRIAKNTTVVLVGQVVSMAITMVVIVSFARSLGEAGFGTFSFLIAFIGIFAIIADFGLGPILLREMARTEFDPGLLLGNVLFLRGLLTAFVFIAVNVAGHVLRFSGELLLLANIMAVNILFSSKLPIQRGIFESVFRVNLRMEIPVFLSVLDSVALLVLTVLFIQGSPSLLLVTVIYTLSNLPGFLLLVFLSAKRVVPKITPRVDYIRFIVKEAMPLALYVAIGTMYDKLDVLFLKVFTSDVDVGVYSAAMRLTSPLNFLPNALAVSFFPLVSRYHLDSDEKVSILYTFAMKTLLVIGVAIAIYVTFTGERIIEILYGGRFSGAVIPLVILIWAQAFVFLNFFQVDFNTAVDQQKVNSTFALILFCTNIILNLLLILHWGLLGASVAKLASVVVGSAYLLYRSRAGKIISEGHRIRRIVILGLLFAAFLWLVNGFGFLLTSISGVLAFLIFIYLLRIYDVTELKNLQLAVSKP
jgi:O-antigen/teichoic acid export membrane protein